MKKLIVLMVAFLFCTVVPAHALLIPTESFGMARNDGTWFTTSSSYLSTGSKGGIAYGFTLDQAYRVTSLQGFINGFGEGAGTVALAIYSGSNSKGMPSGNKVYESQRYNLVMDGQTTSYGGPVDIELAAGEHWFAFEGYANTPSVTQVTGYQLEGDLSQMATVHSPEPTTMLMMGGGILAAWRMRKKKSGPA